jgi:hypothetical protein
MVVQVHITEQEEYALQKEEKALDVVFAWLPCLPLIPQSAGIYIIKCSISD